MGFVMPLVFCALAPAFQMLRFYKREKPAKNMAGHLQMEHLRLKYSLQHFLREAAGILRVNFIQCTGTFLSLLNAARAGSFSLSGFIKK